MNRNLENILSRAANSNLTATALEFVPRSTRHVNSPQPVSSSLHYNNYRKDDGRGRVGNDNRRGHYYRRDRPTVSFDGFDSHSERHQSMREENERYKNRYKVRDRDSHHYDDENSKDLRSNVNEAFLHDHVNQGNVRLVANDDNLSCNDGYKTCDTLAKKPRNDVQDASGSTFEDRRRRISVRESCSRRFNLKRREDDKRCVSASSTSASFICQRDRLIEQLDKGIHECLICCEMVKQREPTWNCGNCYYVLHMWCVIKWARSSTAETHRWRCPACQGEYEQVPEKYICFCGKTKLQTEWNRSDIAHSCGEVCGRNRENPTPWFVCQHPCTLLCHPGPCPPCTVQVKRECGCGRTEQNVQCSTKATIVCGAICDRTLNCGVHHCAQTCHFGECSKCQTKIQVGCYCGTKTTERTCGEDKSLDFSCGEKCGRTLSCGNHICEADCHEGECGLCPRDPVVLITCACGKTPTSENVRQSCLDCLPTCGQVCGRTMKCGPPNRKHTCENACHDGNCGPCPKKTTIKCRCGALERTLPCVKIESEEADFRCQKKCAKKRSCGKHKCNQTCCVDTEHICLQRCNSSLNCGKHRCDLLCHRGKCGRCLESSFEELYCHCGHAVIYPPVSCGTKPPPCDQPCHRQHDCQHSPLHTCHSDRTCPPCTVFTDKLCYGGHELRKTIPCYQKEFSCGLPCNAPLPCGFHKCQVPCHAAACSSVNKKCVQPCSKPRDLCGHPCAAPCHSGVCPTTPCKEMIIVTCACGNITAQHPCNEHTGDYRRIVAALLANKMSELQMNDGTKNEVTARMFNLRTLECTDECKFIMRNRRLALALQIQNPDLSAKLTPKYSDSMKTWAKKDPNLCRHVHDKLTALVKLAKESKQKSRSFSFEVMNKEKRQFVHEYCAHFGCESEAYDAEPKRNVVAIAVKGKCWLPSYSLMEMVQREMGQRKVPVPVFNKKSTSKNNQCATRIILPVLPNADSSNVGINYFGA